MFLKDQIPCSYNWVQYTYMVKIMYFIHQVHYTTISRSYEIITIMLPTNSWLYILCSEYIDVTIGSNNSLKILFRGVLAQSTWVHASLQIIPQTAVLWLGRNNHHYFIWPYPVCTSVIPMWLWHRNAIGAVEIHFGSLWKDFACYVAVVSYAALYYYAFDEQFHRKSIFVFARPTKWGFVLLICSSTVGSIFRDRSWAPHQGEWFFFKYMICCGMLIIMGEK